MTFTQPRTPRTRGLSPLLFTLLLAAAALLAAGCGTALQAQAPAAEDDYEHVMRIGLVGGWPGYGALFIADQQNLFEQAGVEVEVIVFDTATQMNTAFAQREIEIAATVFSDVIAQSSNGIPQQVVWVTDESAGSDAFVAAAGIASAQELVGRRIGVTYGGFSHVFAAAGLARYGVDITQTEIISVDPEELPAALAAGEIDAGHTYDPYTGQTLAAGAAILFSSRDVPNSIVNVITVGEHALEEDTETVGRIVAGIAQATAWWAANPDEGNALVGEATGIPAEEMPAVMSGIRLLTLEENRIALSAEQQALSPLFANTALAAQVFLSTGIVEQSPNVVSLLNSQFVETAAAQ